MYITLMTYDWKSAKRHFDESGITKVPGQLLQGWQNAAVDDVLIRPFKRLASIAKGIVALGQPDLEKEINSTVDRINDLQDKIQSKGKASLTQKQQLKSLTNKFLKLAKKSGNENAIRDAQGMKEDFDRQYRRYA